MTAGAGMDAESEGQARAELFRQEHRLGVQPIGDLITVIEQATGVDVAIVDAGPDEHGMAMRDPQRNAVFIAVARTRHPMRQRSTLAHELGHVLFGDWTSIEMTDWAEPRPEEDRCRAFARHLLIPGEGVQEYLDGRPAGSLAVLSEVVQRFLVSPAMAAVALLQSGMIDEPTREEWGGWHTPQLAARFGWTDQYEALAAESDRRRAPQRLLARTIKGYQLGVLSAQAVATLRGVPAETVEEELTRAGVTPSAGNIDWADPDDLPDPGEVDFSDLDDTAADGEDEAPTKVTE